MNPAPSPMQRADAWGRRLLAALLCLPALASPQDAAHHAHAAHAGSATATAADTRRLVALPAALREHTLANMRDHLLALAEIQAALGSSDHDQAAAIAERRLGLSSLQSHGAHEVGRFMPPAMREAGLAMHRSASRFAAVARDGAVTGDLRASVAALAALNQTCVACHAGFRFH